MKGIQFLVDENNNKTAVQIDLNSHGELWEDFYDTILIEETKDEKITSFDDFIEELKEDKLLDASEIDFIYSNKAAKYTIEVNQSAKKEITKYPYDIRFRILKRIKELEFSSSSNKICGFDNKWKVRIRKNYRMLYDICNETLVIKIIVVRR